jgi:hypothetical protein
MKPLINQSDNTRYEDREQVSSTDWIIKNIDFVYRESEVELF